MSDKAMNVVIRGRYSDEELEEIKAAEKRGAERMLRIFQECKLQSYDVEVLQSIAISESDFKEKEICLNFIWQAWEKMGNE